MSFYLSINRDELHWGGKETISSTFTHIPMCTAHSHIADDGKLTQPMGLWILGSSVKAHYVAAKLRRRAMWIDSELIQGALEDDVTILVYTDGKLIVYADGSRTYKKLDLIDSYVWKQRATDFAIAHALKGNLPPQWASYSTDYMLV